MIAVSGVYRSSFCIIFLFVFDTGTHRQPLLCCEILVPVVNSSFDTTAGEGLNTRQVTSGNVLKVIFAIFRPVFGPQAPLSEPLGKVCSA